MTNENKTCPVCGETKIVSEFGKASRTHDGIQYRCKDCENKKNAEYRKNNPRRNYIYTLTYRYNITEQDYYAMLEKQRGVCGICGKQETRKDNGKLRALSVDHNHETGKVRGLLCDKCNRTLGNLDMEILQKMTDYLEQWK